MPHLHITYGELTVFDGDVEEFTWTDSPGGVTVTGKTKKTAGGGLLELLVGAARRQPEPTPTLAEETDD